MNLGHLFVFEGPDGVGKTALSTGIVASLALSGIDAMYASFPGREYPGTLGSLVYSLHHGQVNTDPNALQVAHIAAHIDAIVGRIRPALGAGRVVILDRFWWSTLAYAEMLGCQIPIVEAALNAEFLAWGEVKPARIYLVERTSATEGIRATRQSLALQSAYSNIANREGHVVRRFQNNSPLQRSVDHIVAEILNILVLTKAGALES